MSSMQEANSLSTITSLASNPPKYPRNPTEQQRPSLTLYIQRVPGSRDVILTPMKPSRKNVTYEDVANSLYFLHYCNPEEASLMAAQEEKPRKSTDTVRTFPRKPLAPPRPSETSTAQTLEPVSPIKDFTERKPLPGQISAPQTRHPSPKSLDPQPVNIHRPGLERSASSASTISRKAVPTRTTGVQTPLTLSAQQARARGYSDTRLTEGSQYLETPPVYQEFSQTSNECPLVSDSFHVILIRRDPTSAAQWNVGEIRGTSTISSDQATSSPAVSVTILTPGYQRFRHQAYPSTTQLEPSESQCRHFKRDIRMDTDWVPILERVKTASQQVVDKMTSQSNGSSPPPPPPPTRSADQPQYPDLSHPASLSTSPTTTRTPPRRPRAKGYTFTSPWNGTCQFQTGTSGRSLKCKHILASHSTHPDTPKDTGAQVSELRFNLPTSDIFGATPTTFGMDTKKLIRMTDRAERKIGHLRGKLSMGGGGGGGGNGGGGGSGGEWDSEEDDFETGEEVGEGDEGRYGLRLGQEKAGGGNRGKRAKLGKLIVHDEGLKMLDLIVAANMGIWWEVWER